MVDYIKKYQSGGKTPPVDNDPIRSFIDKDLSFVKVKAKSMMSGLSKSVYDDTDKNNLLSLSNIVKSLDSELVSRRNGVEGSSKYKDKSTQELRDRYNKLGIVLKKTVQDKAVGYTESTLKYLEKAKEQALKDPKYSEEDKIYIHGFFDREVKDWSRVANEVYKTPKIQTIQSIMKEKEVGYTSEIKAFKNGGKLIPKGQSGLLLQDPGILDLIQRKDPKFSNYKGISGTSANGYFTVPGINPEEYKGPVGNFDPSNYTTPNGINNVNGYNTPQQPSDEYIRPGMPDTSIYTSPAALINKIVGGKYKSPSINVGDYKTPNSSINPNDYVSDTELIPRFKGSIGTPAEGAFGNRRNQSFDNNQASKYSSINEAKALEGEYTNDSESTEKPNKGSNFKAPFISRTGIGAIQFNDIAQYLLARKAYKTPVAVTPVALEHFQSQGSRNVRGVSGIDSSIRNQVENNIASIGGSGYQGSDPIMQMITNLNISKAKKDAKTEWVGQQAEHIRNENIRFSAESEQKRQQIADDLAENNRVRNVNEANVSAGKIKDAELAVANTAGYYKNLSSIFSNIQGRWNANESQRNTARAALWKENKDREYNQIATGHSYNERNISEAEYEHRTRREDYKKSLGDIGETALDTKLSDYDKAFKNKNKDLYDKRVEYTTKLGVGVSEDELMDKHREISKGERLIRKKKKNKEI
jgi:hypothetical protein